MKLPMTIDELTPEWLTMVLAERFPGVSVKSARVEKIIWGTATKVLLGLTYNNDSDLSGPPRSVCVKGGFDPKLRGLALAAAYQREADFYAHLAPRLDIPLARCWFAGADLAQEQGVVILDDLVSIDCTFGEPTQAWSTDQVAAALDVQARWHGPTWGATLETYPWLGTVPPVRQVAEVMLSTAYWDSHFSDDAAPPVPATFLDQKRMQRAFLRSWQFEDAAEPCVLHADPHVGNTYIDKQQQPAFIDWQAVCIGPALDDVTYFMGGALSVEDRRANEHELLKHYLDALARAGGPRMTFDDAWLSYRRFQVHGFLWVTTGSMQQTPERVAAMSERHLAAMEDLECFAALGV